MTQIMKMMELRRLYIRLEPTHQDRNLIVRLKELTNQRLHALNQLSLRKINKKQRPL